MVREELQASSEVRRNSLYPRPSPQAWKSGPLPTSFKPPCSRGQSKKPDGGYSLSCEPHALHIQGTTRHSYFRSSGRDQSSWTVQGLGMSWWWIIQHDKAWWV